MKSFISFIISFCVVLAVIGAVYILFPNAKLSKSVKYIAVLSLLCAFLGLFCIGFKLDVNFNIDVPNESYFDNNTEYIKLIFEKALSNNNIKYDKVDICTDKNENGSIIISKIIIFTNESKEKISDVLGKTTDYEVEVING